MAITVQARAANGEWHTRSAFVDDNKLVLSGTMQKAELLRKAHKLCEQWRAYDDGKQLRVHDDETDPKPATRKPVSKIETAARALGWVTEQELNGVDDHHGVVHPRGHCAPDWAAAVAFQKHTPKSAA